MNRRTFEGPMDWEYQNSRGPVDVSSPFSQIPQRSMLGPAFSTESPSRPGKAANPFAAIGAGRSGAAPQPGPPSPSKQAFPRPPSASIFHPPSTAAAAKSNSSGYPVASPFRNPAFTTPQKRAEEIFSECSGAEESPAMQSDVSMVPEEEDTPDYDRTRDGLARAMRAPASSAVSRRLFDNDDDDDDDNNNNNNNNRGGALGRRQPSPTRPTSSHAPGRGAVPRGNKLDPIFGRSHRVRKRKRTVGDKDVGSVRARFHPAAYSSGESDDSDASEWGSGGGGGQLARRTASGTKKRTGGSGGEGQELRRGAIASLFSAIHEHPNVPLILSWWAQLGMNLFFMGVVMWFVWGGISMMRADISHAADAARSQLLAQMNACAHEYTKNRCAPKHERLPALNVMCNEWEVCMNQDPSSVMKMQVSAKNVAEIINEFVGVMSFKAWGFILSAMLAVILASNLGFSRFREAAFVGHKGGDAPAPHAYHPPPAGAPTPSLPASQDPNQAYIWAPIGQTPRHIRREYLLQPDTPTDTDASPDAPRASILPAPPPQTPSARRSPSKGERERERSPSKAARSPSKGY